MGAFKIVFMSHVTGQPISVQWQHVFQQLVAAKYLTTKNTDVSLCPCASKFVLLCFCCMMQCLVLSLVLLLVAMSVL